MINETVEVWKGTIQRRGEGALVMVMVLFARCSGAAMEKPPSSGRAALEEGRSLVEVGGQFKKIGLIQIIFKRLLVAAAFF